MRLLPHRLLAFSTLGLGLTACARSDLMVDDGAAEAGVETATDGLARISGGPETLDLVTWNVEWLGNRSFGPSDDSLQLTNVARTIELLDADLIALQEIADVTAFDDLLDRLPASYDGLLASDGDVDGNRSYRYDEQQVGFIWRTERLQLRDAQVVLRDLDWAFAGRPPLLARFAIDGRDDEVRTVITLHAKASSDLESWRRREMGARGLQSLLEGSLEFESVAIAGDFNDDLDESIRRDKPSPYANLRNAYRFASWALALSGISTTDRGRHAIDHIMLTGAWDAGTSAQAGVVYPSVRDFSRTTSNHYPVMVSLPWPAPEDTDTPPSDDDSDASDTATIPASVVINEVLANEPGSDPDGEFVELVNPGDLPIPLGDWTLSDRAQVRHQFGPDAQLGPREALVIYGRTASEGSLALSNGGDQVVLADARGQVVAEVSFSSQLTARDGVSMVRAVDGDDTSEFVLHDTVSSASSSPGAPTDGGDW